MGKHSLRSHLLKPERIVSVDGIVDKNGVFVVHSVGTVYKPLERSDEPHFMNVALKSDGVECEGLEAGLVDNKGIVCRLVKSVGSVFHLGLGNFKVNRLIGLAGELGDFSNRILQNHESVGNGDLSLALFVGNAGKILLLVGEGNFTHRILKHEESVLNRDGSASVHIAEKLFVGQARKRSRKPKPPEPPRAARQ